MSQKVIKSSKSQNTTGLLVGALVFGLIAAGLSALYLKNREAAIREALAEKQSQMVAVVVAAGDLPPGTVITKQNVAVRKIPREFVYPQVILPEQFANVEGRFLVKPLAQGTPLLVTFIETDIARSFSDTIDVGRRAMTIQVDEVNSVSGFIRPDDHIDLFVYGRIKGGIMPAGMGGEEIPDTDVVLPVLQNVKVLATGRDAHGFYQERLVMSQQNKNPFNYTTLTVDVSAKEAAMLAKAEDSGDIIALLRNRKDQGRADFTIIDGTSLIRNAIDMAEAARIQAENNSADCMKQLQPGDVKMVKGVVVDANDKPLAGLVTKPDGSVTTSGGRPVLDATGKLVEGVVMTPTGQILEDPDLRVNDDCMLVTKDGVVLSGRGLVVGEDGRLRTHDGKEVKARDLMVTEDGKLITADGVVLRESTLALDENGKVIKSGGFRVTEDGFIVTEDGRIMTKDGHVLEGAVLGADGKVRTADGELLIADDIIVNEDGSVTRADGSAIAGITASKDPAATRVMVTEDGFIVASDGTIMTADGKVLEGVTLGPDGKVRTADGTVLKAGDIVVNADGTVTDKNGKLIAGVTGKDDPARSAALMKGLATDFRETEDGFLVAADGTIMTRDGKVLEGVTLGADGKVRAADGTVLKASDIVVQADGSVTRRDGTRIAGVRADANSPQAKIMQKLLETREALGGGPARRGPGELRTFRFIAGGTSKDGVLPVNDVAVVP